MTQRLLDVVEAANVAHHSESESLWIDDPKYLPKYLGILVIDAHYPKIAPHSSRTGPSDNAFFDMDQGVALRSASNFESFGQPEFLANRQTLFFG